MTAPLHLVGTADGPDDLSRRSAGRPPRPASRLGCRYCGLSPQEHGIHLIHRFVQTDPPPADPGAAQLDPPLLAA